MTEPPVDAPPEEPDLRCPRCGAPHDRYQEYCLTCGARLVRLYAPRQRWVWSQEVWSRESPLWLWAALAALLLVALVSGAIVALAATGDEERPRRAARAGGTSTLQVLTDITTSTVPPTFTVQPTTTLSTTTGTTATTGTTTTTTTTTSGNRISSWPAGKRGYTVVVASVPTSQGRGRAEATAREAIAKGVDDVGILNSSDYTSLRPGYYVVFSGVHDTEREAENALPTVRNAGYPVAYVREVRP